MHGLTELVLILRARATEFSTDVRRGSGDTPEEGFGWKQMCLLKRIVSQQVEFFFVVNGAAAFNNVAFDVFLLNRDAFLDVLTDCLLYTSPSPRDP